MRRNYLAKLDAGHAVFLKQKEKQYTLEVTMKIGFYVYCRAR